MRGTIAEFINKKNGKNCTGCKMCADVCLINAISFPLNSEGFWYPLVSDKCIKCGKCVKVCPIFGNNEKKHIDITAQKCFGCRNKSNEIRLNSTSGGFFSTLACHVINEGYSIAGAVYGNDMQVLHKLCDNEEDIKKLRQSKYVQSDTFNIYAQVANILKRDSKVLFVGTPCQVAALYSFLVDMASTSNLLTMDFICYGVPSPLLYKRYLEWLEKKHGSKIKSIQFKNKKHGWRSLGTLVTFENGKKYLKDGSVDYFMQAFVSEGLATRESCYNCNFRTLYHNSDFTVGDFWGIEKINPEMDDNKGITAVMVNTFQAIGWFEKIKNDFDYFETSVENIAAGNFTIHKSAERNLNREAFLSYLNNHSIDNSMRKYSNTFSFQGYMKRKYHKVRKIIGKLKRTVVK